MSPKIPVLQVGLAALGLFGSCTRYAHAADAPRAPAAPPPAQVTIPPPKRVPAALATAPAQPQAPANSVLLLYNGRVLQGQLAREDNVYVLKQRLGVIRFPKRDVEKVFGSIEEVYRYKLSRLPQDDPDERIKLARWCLEMKLPAAARTELEAVVALSPGHREATTMIASLDAAAERATRRDPGIVQTSGVDSNAPEELSPAMLRSPRNPGASPAFGVPVIFDLPPAMATRRSQEFSRFVHPELQKLCARCHNERHTGSFQLVQARTAREMADPAIVRTNMEAALLLVDRANPSQSLLLTSMLMPHKPDNKPILLNAKSRPYQYLSTWVNSLQPQATPPSGNDPSTASVAGANAPGQGGGFASDRGAQGAVDLSGSPLTPLRPSTGSAPAIPQYPPAEPTLPGQLAPDSYTGPPLTPPPGTKFPTSPLMTGQLPGPPKPPAQAGTQPADAPVLPDARTADPATLRAAARAAAKAADDKAEAAAKADPKRKKRDIDAGLLEKVLSTRNQ